MLAHASLSAGSPLPTPWVNQDIGSTGLLGSASASGGVFTVSGAGGDIWGTTDAFQSVMQPITGDVQIITRVTTIQNTNTSAYRRPDIVFDGVVNNPIGITDVFNARGDILSTAPEVGPAGLVRTDSFDIEAIEGEIVLRLDVVESNDGPIGVDRYRIADAGGDVFVNIQGLLRRDLVGGEHGSRQ
jgi:hypothetical protein